MSDLGLSLASSGSDSKLDTDGDYPRRCCNIADEGFISSTSDEGRVAPGTDNEATLKCHGVCPTVCCRGFARISDWWYQRGVPEKDRAPHPAGANDFRRALRDVDLDSLRRALKKNPTLVNQFLKTGEHPFQYIVKKTVEARKESLELVHELLKYQADVNSRDKHGRTALWHAVKYDQLEVVTLLLQLGAEVDAKDNNGTTPLQNAQNGDMARLLITHGADANTRDSLGNFPLYKAAERGDYDWFMFLVEHGADIHAKDASGLASIHEARSNLDILRYLLEEGVDVNVASTKGTTPLMYGRWNLEVTRLLLQHGANVNARNLDGNTVFSYCTNVEMAQLLIEHGADIIIPGETALDGAAEVNSVEMVRFLLEHGIDANAQSVSNRTPLHATFYTPYYYDQGRREQTLKLLIAYGADVNAREGDTGLSVLHRACRYDDVALVELLLQDGADVHASDNEGWTPLLWACAFCKWAAVRKLVEHGAAVNVCALTDSTTATYNGGVKSRARTPLSMACRRNEVQVVQDLLNAGAWVDYRDKDGRTPLLHAVKKDRLIALTVLLLKRGADIHAQPYNENVTPFLLACAKGGLDLIYSMIRFTPHHQRPNPIQQPVVKKGREWFGSPIFG